MGNSILLLVASIGALLSLPVAGSGQGTPVSGRYSLRAIDGQPLPWPIRDDRGRALAEFVSGTMEFAPDGTVLMRTVVKDDLMARVPCAVLRQALSDKREVGGTGGMARTSAEPDTTCQDLWLRRDSSATRYTLTGDQLLIRGTQLRGDTASDVATYSNDSIIVRKVIFRSRSQPAHESQLLYVRETER